MSITRHWMHQRSADKNLQNRRLSYILIYCILYTVYQYTDVGSAVPFGMDGRRTIRRRRERETAVGVKDGTKDKDELTPLLAVRGRCSASLRD